MQIHEKILLTRREASEVLGVKPSTLASWSCKKTYPLKFVKIGRLVKYRYCDLLHFIEARTKEGCSKDFKL